MINVVHLVLISIACVAWFGLWLDAVGGILRQPHMSVSARAVWVVATLMLPVVGPILWFATGSARASRDERTGSER